MRASWEGGTSDVAWPWQGPGHPDSVRALRDLETILEEILWAHRAVGSQQCWRKVCAKHQGDLGLTDRGTDGHWDGYLRSHIHGSISGL